MATLDIITRRTAINAKYGVYLAVGLLGTVSAVVGGCKQEVQAPFSGVRTYENAKTAELEKGAELRNAEINWEGKILYITRRDFKSDYSLREYDLKTKVVTKVGILPRGFEEIACSPNGRYLFYSYSGDGGFGHIVVLRRNKASRLFMKITDLAVPANYSSAPSFVFDPLYNYLFVRFLFPGNTKGDAGYRFYLLDLNVANLHLEPTASIFSYADVISDDYVFFKTGFGPLGYYIKCRRTKGVVNEVVNVVYYNRYRWPEPIFPIRNGLYVVYQNLGEIAGNIEESIYITPLNKPVINIPTNDPLFVNTTDIGHLIKLYSIKYDCLISTNAVKSDRLKVYVFEPERPIYELLIELPLKEDGPVSDVSDVRVLAWL